LAYEALRIVLTPQYNLRVQLPLAVDEGFGPEPEGAVWDRFEIKNLNILRWMTNQNRFMVWQIG
jgi:hypothetical protein